MGRSEVNAGLLFTSEMKTTAKIKSIHLLLWFETTHKFYNNTVQGHYTFHVVIITTLKLLKLKF